MARLPARFELDLTPGGDKTPRINGIPLTCVAGVKIEADGNGRQTVLLRIEPRFLKVALDADIAVCPCAGECPGHQG